MSYFFNHVNDIEFIQRLIIQELKEFNIKVPKIRKNNVKQDNASPNVVIFGSDLCNLPRFTTRHRDVDLDLPHFLVEAVTIIQSKIKVEGLFRKAGSVHRQKELKRFLESGGKLEGSDVHDVANLVKQFLRQLPNPLIPTKLQDLFVKAYNLNGEISMKLEALQLLCALLPIEHLHVLIYLLDFLSDLASNSVHNRMNAHNLAVVIAPNVFVTLSIDKSKGHCAILHQQAGVVQLLIENPGYVGRLPDAVLNKATNQARFLSINTSEDDLDCCKESEQKSAKRERKKRYSLTGMSGVILGLRRIVQPNQGSSDELSTSPGQLQDRNLITPNATKRKHGGKDEESGSSSSKRRALASKTSVSSNPIPVVPALRFDSPSAGQNEDLVSISPSTELTHQKGRKSTRLRFFGKTYLQRRNSITKTPKSASKVKREVVNAMKVRSSSAENSVTCTEQEKSSPLLSKAKTTADSDYCVLTAVKSKSILSGATCGLHLAVSVLPDGKSNSESSLVLGNEPHLAERAESSLSQRQTKTDEVLVMEPEESAVRPATETESSGSATANVPKAPISIDASKYVRLAAMKVGSSMEVQSESSPLEKPQLFRRSAYKSSLRRGRPNTVSSGLQLPSPFKCPSERKFKSISSPALVTNVRKIAEESLIYNSPVLQKTPNDGIGPVKRIAFDETEVAPDSPPPLPKTDPPILESVSQTLLSFEDSIDSEVFISDCDTKTFEENPNGAESQTAALFVNVAKEKPTVDSTAPPRSLKNRRMSISLTNIMSPPEYADPLTRTKSTNLEMSGGCKPDGLIKWKCAAAALGRELPDEIPNIGRPSLVRIFKERAGTVSATAKQYDAIFISGSKNTPIQNTPNRRPSRVLSTASPVKIPNVFQQQNMGSDGHIFKTPTTASMRNSSTKTSQHRTRSRNSTKLTQNESSDGKATPKTKTPKVEKVNNDENAKENRSTSIRRRLSQKIVEKLASGVSEIICNAANANAKPLTPSKLENYRNKLSTARVIRSKSDRTTSSRSPKYDLPLKSPSFNSLSKSKMANRCKARKVPSFGRRQNLSCDKRRSTSL